LRARGEIDGAIEILERQVELYPNLVNGFWRLAGIAADRGRIEEAVRYYQHCIEINPSLANFANRRIAALRGE
jgi:tetratricopeptide (TPR) repeat protein